MTSHLLNVTQNKPSPDLLAKQLFSPVKLFFKAIFNYKYLSQTAVMEVCGDDGVNSLSARTGNNNNREGSIVPEILCSLL